MHRVSKRIKQGAVAFGLAITLTLATVVPSFITPLASGAPSPSPPPPASMDCPWC